MIFSILRRCDVKRINWRSVSIGLLKAVTFDCLHVLFILDEGHVDDRSCLLVTFFFYAVNPAALILITCADDALDVILFFESLSHFIVIRILALLSEIVLFFLEDTPVSSHHSEVAIVSHTFVLS